MRPCPTTDGKGQELPRRAEILRAMALLSEHYLQGKLPAIRLAMISLLAGGHLLLEDIPGLGKTTLALALARALGLSFGRIQCTSDLLPSDITGLSIFDQYESCFRFVPGPIFNHVVLADEINRAMPKTQSAMLEAMEEGRVTVDGTTYELPDPFLVIATQNPVEQVGTYPLPESQLDRFLVTTGLGYPPAEIEKTIIRGGSIREKVRQLAPLLGLDDLLAARQAIRERVYLSDRLVDYIYQLAAATRNHRLVHSGLSTRGAISLADAARAAAYLEGRVYVAPEDVKSVAGAVAAHRLILRTGSEGVRKQEVLESLLKELPVPLV